MGDGKGWWFARGRGRVRVGAGSATVRLQEVG